MSYNILIHKNQCFYPFILCEAKFENEFLNAGGWGVGVGRGILGCPGVCPERFSAGQLV